jgi:hypothetical protein
MPRKTWNSLDELVAFVQAEHAAGRTVYCRYSKGPAVDATPGNRSRNHATGQAEAGLSVNRLNAPGHPEGASHERVIAGLAEYVITTIAHDGTYCWLLHGTEVGCGGDNEPLVTHVVPLGTVAPAVVDEAAYTNVARIKRESAIRDCQKRMGLAFDNLPHDEQELAIQEAIW